jgi:membrane protein required for colicin V production
LITEASAEKNMTLVDWIILGGLVVATLGGLAQGFFRAACGLAGLVFGYMAAVWNYHYIARVFIPLVQVEAVANAIGFLLIILLVMLAGALLGGFLEKMFRFAGLGCIDSLLGAVLGFLQGVVVVMVFVVLTLAFFPGATLLTNARIPPMFFEACHVSMDMSPQQLSNQMEDGLKRLKQESPGWIRNPGHESK